ncbi:ABC transporter permease [Streptomyces sp. NPDC091292]|uniref:ABC transporter permease n=1 Tax=Streptomyces sp. NPDC091292 TaxID=3365991 RepID=UPI00380E26EA
MSAPTLSGVDRMTILLHRRVLWLGLGLAVLAGVLAGAVRLWTRAASDRAACLAGADRAEECGSGIFGYRSAEGWDRLFAESGATLLLVLPALLAALVAGPVIARELDGGLHRLAWTQSVTPARWLTSRLAVFATAALALSTVLVLVYRLIWQPPAADPDGYWSYGLYWHTTGSYEATGPVLVALSLLGVSVGALAGVVTRRTIVALASGALAMAVVQFALVRIRFRLWPHSTASWLTGQNGSPPAGKLPSGPIWYGPGGWINGSGERLPFSLCDNAGGTEAYVACRERNNVVGQYVDFHPASHHWPLQFVETGIILALTAVAVLVTFRVLRSRTP